MSHWIGLVNCSSSNTMMWSDGSAFRQDMLNDVTIRTKDGENDFTITPSSGEWISSARDEGWGAVCQRSAGRSRSWCSLFSESVRIMIQTITEICK